jgi:hypothetical protein
MTVITMIPNSISVFSTSYTSPIPRSSIPYFSISHLQRGSPFLPGNGPTILYPVVPSLCSEDLGRPGGDVVLCRGKRD